jgi:hypothetical protein
MSESCYWLTIFQLALPVLCVLNFARHIAHYGFMWMGLAGLTLYQVILFTTPLLLGNLRHLEVPTYKAALFTIGAILALRTILGLKALGKAIIALRYRPRWVDPLLLLCSALALNLWITQLFSAWRMGPSEFDANNYHIPRVFLWSWHGNFDGWGTATWQQLGAAFGGSASLLPSIFLGCGFVTFSWAGTLYSLGASLGVFVIGRSLGLSCRASYLSLLAFLIFPSVALRVSGVSSDIAATFPAISAVALFLSLQRTESKVFYFPALMGLGMACKQYVLFSGTLLGLVLILKSWNSLWNRRVILSGIAGVGVALFFLFLSYFPIYQMFGDLMGGSAGKANSNLGGNIQAIISSLAYQFIHWLSEPISVISNQTEREYWYFKLGFGELYKLFNLHSGSQYIPVFTGNNLRTGLLSIAALPILIFGVKRGYRWVTLLGFIALCVIQLAPLSLNTTGRFLIVPLAGFALLWGARSEKYPILVTLCVIGAYWGTRAHLNITEWKPDTSLKLVIGYSECKELPNMLGSESISLLTRPLAIDSNIPGRLGLARFEYAYCPGDGNWPKYLEELKTKSRWFAMYPERPLAAGVNYPSNLGYPCQGGRVELEQMKSWLAATGWQFVAKLECGLEVYSSQAQVS